MFKYINMGGMYVVYVFAASEVLWPSIHNYTILSDS